LLYLTPPIVPPVKYLRATFSGIAACTTDWTTGR